MALAVLLIGALFLLFLAPIVGTRPIVAMFATTRGVLNVVGDVRFRRAALGRGAVGFAGVVLSAATRQLMNAPSQGRRTQDIIDACAADWPHTTGSAHVRTSVTGSRIKTNLVVLDGSAGTVVDEKPDEIVCVFFEDSSVQRCIAPSVLSVDVSSCFQKYLRSLVVRVNCAHGRRFR